MAPGFDAEPGGMFLLIESEVAMAETAAPNRDRGLSRVCSVPRIRPLGLGTPVGCVLAVEAPPGFRHVAARR